MRFVFVVHKNEEKAEQNSVLFHRLTLKERGLRPNGYFPLMRQPLLHSLWRRHPDLNWGIKVLQTSIIVPVIVEVSSTHLELFHKKFHRKTHPDDVIHFHKTRLEYSF